MARTVGIGHQNFEQLITNDYFYIDKTGFIKEWWERDFFETVSMDMDDATATLALHELSGYLYRYYGKKVLILLDEYDTPMLEPCNKADNAIIMEFKIFRPSREKSLEDTKIWIRL